MLDSELLALDSVLNMGAGDYDASLGHGGVWTYMFYYKDRTAIDANCSKLPRWKENGWDTHCIELGKKVVLPFAPKSFDLVIGTDFLEHLTMDDANHVIKIAEELAKKYVVWFTPIGFLDVEKYQSALCHSEYDKHLSGFEPEFFRALGYTVDVYENFHRIGSHSWGAMWSYKEL